MAYLSAKKIYPGNWAEPLTGWYKNIDTTDNDTNDSSAGGPTAVLAVPGWKYFQNRGYAEVTGKVGAKWNNSEVIVPSPYRNDDTRTDITGMVVSASAGWEIDLLPDAFLWNQQIDAGKTPQPEDLLLFSSQGLTFVGSQQNPSAEGIGDLMIYNACEGPCKEESTNWVFQLDPDCSSIPAVFVREVGNPFFERISPSNSGLGEQPLEVTLRPYEWLQVLTHCRWSAAPTAG